MENNRTSDKKLLVARSNERCRKIYKWMWYISKNEELDRGTSREVEVEWGTREAMDVSNGGLYHWFTIGSRERHDFGSIW